MYYRVWFIAVQQHNDSTLSKPIWFFCRNSTMSDHITKGIPLEWVYTLRKSGISCERSVAIKGHYEERGHYFHTGLWDTEIHAVGTWREAFSGWRYCAASAECFLPPPVNLSAYAFCLHLGLSLRFLISNGKTKETGVNTALQDTTTFGM